MPSETSVSPCCLHKAALSDETFFLKVRNSPDIRKASFHQNRIPASEHHRWFTSVLKDPDQILFVIKNFRGDPAGTIRLNRVEENTAEIHIGLLAKYRKKGYGRVAVRQAIQEACHDRPAWNIQRVIATILKTNMRSICFFESLGFKYRKTFSKIMRPAVSLQWKRYNFLIFIDLGSRIGMGHWMREWSLANQLTSLGHRVYFSIRQRSGSLQEIKKILRSLRNPFTYPLITPQEAFQNASQWNAVILDTMTEPTHRFIHPILKANVPVILIGNYLAVPVWAKACINPYSKPRLGSRRTLLRLSQEYTILAPDFIRQVESLESKSKRQSSSVFILPGGGNTSGMIFKILKALSPVKELILHVVLGPFFTETSRVKTLIDKMKSRVKLYQNIDSRKVAQLMMQSQIGILSYGRSLDEARRAGLPALLLSSSPLNRAGSLYAAQKGGVIYLGDFKQVTDEALRTSVLKLLRHPAKRQALAKKGRALVDGKGAERAANFILDTVVK